MRNHRCLLTLAALVAALALSACAATPAPAAGEASATLHTGQPTAAAEVTFTDPFEYCAAVGTIDAPDERYTGPEVPDSVAQGLQSALGLTGTPPPPIAQNSLWRCMDGMVYACTVGANLPCQEKADTSRTPTEAMIKYCQEEPDSEFIPAAVTGRATVYSWRCTEGEPEIIEQVFQVDAQGFLADFWYELQPPQ
ncbi:MAG: hypothetical protein HPY83_05940 [Anaerolineae bacterium]|nr:hypothetical protein [Anaerolineae bacterium]